MSEDGFDGWRRRRYPLVREREMRPASLDPHRIAGAHLTACTTEIDGIPTTRSSP